MYNLIKNYVDKMSINDIDIFLKNENIFLSQDELSFSYNFIKKNIDAIYSNPYIDLSKFKNNFSLENYNKLISLYQKYITKYSSYLK